MKTKQVPVWYVPWSSGEGATYVSSCPTYQNARIRADGLKRQGYIVDEITGPHYQTVRDWS